VNFQNTIHIINIHINITVIGPFQNSTILINDGNRSTVNYTRIQMIKKKRRYIQQTKSIFCTCEIIPTSSLLTIVEARRTSRFLQQPCSTAIFTSCSSSCRRTTSID
jgi:hypothetical protein